jgi:hypothetical protein
MWSPRTRWTLGVTRVNNSSEDMMSISTIVRHRLHFSIDGRTITVSGVALSSEQATTFQPSLATIRQWDDGAIVSIADRAAIIRKLTQAARRCGWQVQL